MAKCEWMLHADFDAVLQGIDDGILNGSVSAELEDQSDYERGGIRCAVRVYERYSALGGNRVSLNITLLGEGDELFLPAITAGGSQAVLFKINTLGEHAFLDCLREVLRPYLA